MSGNTRRGMERELTRLRRIATPIALEGAPEPRGWDWNVFRERTRWLDKKLVNKKRGDMNRIVGGPEIAAALLDMAFAFAEVSCPSATP